ncbi:MAG TPA: aminotransferase class I/II-fold pyridoxal phosphate-dependent enzyme, partial [Candidatus Methanomethylicus sp.]|nr:aminotransferase class I/II-fold pyridoxal phosphate-dependent enzyme [Candidatus Methanomethylicus sp.]
MSLSERLDHVPPSGIRRLFELASRYPDAISLGIGEPDFDTPLHIREYAKEALDLGYTHYTPNSGLQMLRDALAGKLRSENSIDADPDRNIMVTVGANQAITLALAAFLRAGEEVLIPSPCFVTHKAAVTIAGGSAVEVATDESCGFSISSESLSRAVTKKTRCILLNSPNNPTGAVLSRKQLEEIATVAVEHRLRVISDEVYEALVYDGNAHVSIASLEGMADSTITINSFSKAYAMTGWRLGYVVADPTAIEKMIKLQMYL